MTQSQRFNGSKFAMDCLSDTCQHLSPAEFHENNVTNVGKVLLMYYNNNTYNPPLKSS
jgi:hypothetical protein